MTWSNLLEWSKEDIKKRCKEYDDFLWHTEMEERSTLHIYREEKLTMGYENCYNNLYASEFLAKARTNSLKLGEWKGRGSGGRDQECKLCGYEIEDLSHFLIACQPLESHRNKEIMDLTRGMNNREATATILFRTKDAWEKIATMIMNLWIRREHLLNQLNQQRYPNIHSQVPQGL